MIKKEIRDSFKSILSRSGIILLPAVGQLFFKRYPWSADYWLPVMIFYMISVLWISSNLGTQAFKTEAEDNAVEYLMAGPRSNALILAVKFGVRFALVVFLNLVYLLCHLLIPVAGKYYIVLRPQFLVLFSMFLLMVGCLLSPLQSRNDRAAYNVVLVLLYVPVNALVVFVWRLLSPDFTFEQNWFFAGLVSMGLISIFLVIPFLWTFRQYRSQAFQVLKRRIQFAVFPPVMLLAVFGLITMFR